MMLLHAFCLGGLTLLYRREKQVFCMMLPLYLINICLPGWSYHVRYYAVLWGINIAWYQALIDNGRMLSNKSAWLLEPWPGTEPPRANERARAGQPEGRGNL